VKTLRRWLWRIRASLTRNLGEDRFRLEMEEHIAGQTAEYIRSGLSSNEARRQAILKFGSSIAAAEQYRENNGVPLFELLLQDVRYAFRRLRSAPVFSTTTILTVALGIGVTSAIFSLVYAVLLRSLSVADPADLLRLGKAAQCCYTGGYSQDREFSIVSYDLYTYFRDHTEGFSELAAFGASELGYGVRRKGSSAPAFSDMGELVSGNYFQMFKLQPFAGRLLNPADDRAGATPVAVMSYRLWSERYGSDFAVIGSSFDLSGRSFTIVGIAPPSFFGDSLRAQAPDFYIPLMTGDPGPDGDRATPSLAWLQLIGRKRPGFSMEGIQAQMQVELKQWLRSQWGRMSANDRALLPRQTLHLAPGGGGITGMRDQYQKWLRTLMMVSGFVLLIVCVNVANLMLVRSMQRRRETAVSVALGARSAALMRQAFSESLLLSLFGGVFGVAIAMAGTRLIIDFVFPRVGQMAGVPVSATPSLPVLAFAFAVSFATGILFGIAPAWVAVRVAPIDALRGAQRSTARTESVPRKILIALQAALALVLISASGLLTMGLHSFEHQDFGFRTDHRTIVAFDPHLAGYTPNQLHPLYGRIKDAISRIPAVEQVALATYSPLNGNNWGSPVWINGHDTPGPNEDTESSWTRITPNFLSSIGGGIARGRALDERDTAAAEHTAVVNETFARKFFPHEDPIGRYFGWASDTPTRYKIVGVAKDARYLTSGLEKPVTPFFFLPEGQHDFDKSSGKERSPSSNYMQNIVIVERPGANLTQEAVRLAMASVDPNLPVTSMRTFQQQVEAVFRPAQLMARLTSFFGLLAIVLSSIGLYGLTAYNAGQRTKEIGVRMALGATPSRAVTLLLRGPFVLIVIGLALGLPITLAISGTLSSQTFGGDPHLLLVETIGVIVLLLTGFLAALVPALRASSISPCQALRND
jgi:predicted permease